MAKTKAPSSYRKLFSNTLTFAIGSFSSKILVILLIPIYTNALSKAEGGITDVLTQIANWAIPIASVTIAEAVIRFGLDKAYDKKAVFTIGNVVCLGGLGVFGVLMFIFTIAGVAKNYLGTYGMILYLYIFMSSMKTLYSTYVRALERVKLFAVNGIITTLFTLLFNVLFYMVFPKDYAFFGIGGVFASPVAKYLLAVLLSDFISIIFLIFTAKLWKHFDRASWNRDLLRTMLQYSVPLIPAQLLWLITNSSDTFMTTYIMGENYNGVLSAAYKIPNIVATVYLMFGQAWNMSAITENDSKDRDQFYEKVFDFNQSLIYILAGGCLLIIQPLTNILIGAEFHDSIRYSPILIYSTVFSCFTTFMGSIYIATKKSKRSLFTSFISGAVNVGVNLLLIPRIGLYGPAISTVVAYLAVFVARVFDSRKLIPFRIDWRKLVFNNIILVAMTLINTALPDFLKEIDASDLLIALSLMTLYAIVFVYNAKSLSTMLHRFLPKKLADHFDNASTAKDVFWFCTALIIITIVGIGFYMKVLGVREAAAIVVGFAAAIAVIRKPAFGYPVLVAISAFVALKQGLFAAVCAYFLMIAPCLIYKKRFADAATLTALTGLLMGYYANALLGVFGVLIQVPAYAITYRGDIKRAVRRFVNNR
ncbi:MAG: polysaccharide biosynthesis C-terminal domain-containing protein [Ruminococcus sp.]|nr:polysaccharide biosynthesis C-terminal domain-containing protein [Ruminococcus sp.]